MSEIVFTPASVLALLTEIEELKNRNITFSELDDGSIQFKIDTNTYVISADGAEDVEIDDDAMAQIAEINETGYDMLEAEGIEFDDNDVVEGGIIKELIKTLFIGGMARLNNKMMSKDQFDAYVKQANKYRR